MTALERPVRRVTQIHGRPVVVTIEPDGIVTFRQKGRRHVIAVSLASCMNLAAAKAAEALRIERKAKRAARRAA